MPRPTATPLPVPAPVSIALYARVSAESQAEKDLSIPAQLKAMREYAGRQGWTVVAEYVDEGKSGRTDKREAFQNMIQAARSAPPPFTRVICWKLDRFARSREISVLHKAALRRKGVQVLSLNESIDDSPAGRFNEGLLESAAQFFSENLAADVKRGLKKNAEDGWYNGGTVPYGYRAEHVVVGASTRRTLVPDATTAPAVQRVFALYLEGKSTGTICDILNQEDWPLRDPIPARNGHYAKKWHFSRVVRMLRNPIYMGTLRWGFTATQPGGGKRKAPAPLVLKPNTHPPLVSAEDFQRVQQRLDARHWTNAHPRTLGNSRYLLTGLLRCGLCGGPLNGYKCGRSDSRFFYYRCVYHWHRGKERCPALMARVEKVDAAVLGDLQALASDMKLLKRIIAEANHLQQREHAEQRKAGQQYSGQLKDIEKRLTRLYNALETGTLSHEELAPRIRQLQQQQKTLLQAQAAQQGTIPEPSPLTVTDIQRGLSVFQERFATLSREEQVSLLRVFLRKVTVQKPTITLDYHLGLVRTVEF